MMGRKTFVTGEASPRGGLPLRPGLPGLALLLGAMLVSSSGLAQQARAQTSSLAPALLSAGWQVMEVPGKARAQFTQSRPGAIDVRANGAVAFLYRPLNRRL